MHKKILFVAPIGNGWPSELYKKIVPLLQEQYGEEFEVELSRSVLWWIKAHFSWKKYDTIVSVLPFLWKPCKNFVLNIHGDYRVERGFGSIWGILAYMYPYTLLFADIIVYPSEYLRKSMNIQRKQQYIIGNICPFPPVDIPKTISSEKEEFTLITTTNWNNPDKANAIIELAKQLRETDFSDKKIVWKIIGGGYEIYEKTLMEIFEKWKNFTINLLGFVPNNRIQEILSWGDIFIYATHRETFGIAILEAASQGIPLVLVQHEAFIWLWNDKSIFDLSDISDELSRMMSDRVYYATRSEMSISDADKFKKDNILKLWRTLLEKSY